MHWHLAEERCEQSLDLLLARRLHTARIFHFGEEQREQPFDFRLDLTPSPPLALLGLLLVYCSDPGTSAAFPPASPTSLAGFLRKQALLDRYSAVSSLALSGIDYYIAFGYWKLTCIIAGVFARYAGGAMGDTSQAQIDGFLDMVRTLSTEAEQAAQHIRATSLTSEAESTGIPHGRD